MQSLDLILIIFLSIGAIQGIIYGIILWINTSPNKTANRFLATILFFFSYRLCVEILQHLGVGNYDIFYHLFLEFNWIYGALIYFFVKAYITPNFKFTLKKEWIHFVPVIIEICWSIFIKSQNFFWDGTRESLTWLGYYGYVIWMHYPTLYIIGGFLIIYYTIKANKLLNSTLSKQVRIEQNNLFWITRILKVLQYFSLLMIALVLVDFFFFDYAFNRIYHYPIFIGMAIITYWLGIEGFNRKNDVILKLKNSISKKEKIQLNKIAKKLKVLMEDEKIYTNQDLSLNKLAQYLDEKPYLTTKCLNIIFEKKFSDFVNEYRIMELKKMLKDPTSKNLTLLALAFDAGFNSKASFNRAVKKLTGKPPSSLKV